MASYTDFSQKLQEMLPASIFPAGTDTFNLSGLTEEQMIKLFGVALGKWLLKICQGAGPKWSVAMRKSFIYSIHATKPVAMLSLAFSFQPNFIAPQDPSGMSSAAIPVQQYPDERECSLHLLESVKKISDVNAILDETSGLKADLMEAKANLLAQAGYDKVQYLNWVKRGERIGSNRRN